jgi:putative transposase
VRSAGAVRSLNAPPTYSSPRPIAPHCEGLPTNTYYILFFIHLHTRRVHIGGMTPNPDGAGMAQVARNTSMTFAEGPADFGPVHIIRDRDSTLAAESSSILETDGVELRPIPVRSPNLNTFAETWVHRTKHEVLNQFIVFGENHLRRILASWLAYCHEVRPHQGLGNVPIMSSLPEPEPLEDFRPIDPVKINGLYTDIRR